MRTRKGNKRDDSTVWCSESVTYERTNWYSPSMLLIQYSFTKHGWLSFCLVFFSKKSQIYFTKLPSHTLLQCKMYIQLLLILKTARVSAESLSVEIINTIIEIQQKQLYTTSRLLRIFWAYATTGIFSAKFNHKRHRSCLHRPASHVANAATLWCFIRGCMQYIPKSQQGHFHFFMAYILTTTSSVSTV